MSDWVLICAMIVVVYAITKVTNTIACVMALKYNYMHESRPPRTLAELFGAWRNCDDEEVE